MTAHYQTHGDVAVITLDNPPVNGLGLSTRQAIVAALEQAQSDAAVRAIVLTGAGKAFSGGADIKEFGSPKAIAEPNLLSLIRMTEHQTKNTAAEHMETFYRPFQEVKAEKFDGLLEDIFEFQDQITARVVGAIAPKLELAEIGRVMAPTGRLIVAVASRDGAWAGAEATPFGHGRPFSRSQLERLIRDAELEPAGWTRALYVPPMTVAAGWAEGFEQVGARLWPRFAGVILMEAVKQTFAVKPRGHRARVRVFTPGVLAPSPVGPAAVRAVPSSKATATPPCGSYLEPSQSKPSLGS